MRNPLDRPHEIGLALEHGDSAVRARLNPRGAALRSLVIDGSEVIQQYPYPTPYFAGLTLAPWPNRVGNARWVLQGERGRMEANEVGRPNAIHGLVYSRTFGTSAIASSRVQFTTTITPSAAWDFSVGLDVTYALVPHGLRVSYNVRNLGMRPAPFAIGAHPFFAIDGVRTEELRLTSSAREVLLNDLQGIPGTRTTVDRDPHLDLRAGRPLRGLKMAQCYTNFALDDGLTGCWLSADDGRSLRIWGDPSFAYWQFFTTCDFPGPDGPTFAVALEPMTAPGDALNTGEGICWIAADESWSASWGISLEAASPS